VRRPLLLAGAIAALIVLSAASCGNNDKDIATAEVGRADVVEVVDAPASVIARAAATLTAPADGSLVRLTVNSGDQVAKGQVIAVVDSPSARKRMQDAKKALDAAKNSGGGGVNLNLGTASSQLDKAAADAFDQARAAVAYIADPQLKKVLLAQIAAGEKQYLAASKAVDSAVRGVQRGVQSLGSAMSALGAAQRVQAQQAYDLSKATVAALTLRAPIAGVIQLGGTSSAGGGAVPSDLTDLLNSAGGGQLTTAPASGATPAGVEQTVAEGGLVSAGTPIATVVDVSELGLVAEVDETDVLLVKPGIDAEVELDAATGVRYPARVASIDVLPTANARGAVAYRVRLTLAPPTGDMPTPRPGMNAVAHLKVREADAAVAVPAAAVFTADGQDMIWVRRADGQAERRPVTIGVSGTDLIQIVSGIQPGDRIVVHGADLVKAGETLP
jgi:multidrug efflux pump subunit AcrA (membrane-fusion protein)